MLPKKNRLNKKEIAFLKEKQQKVLQGDFFGLIVSPSSEKKFGLIISAKIAKKAVERNRVKRLLYRVIESNFWDKPGFFLFLAKKTCLLADSENLRKEVISFKEKIFFN